ncbi:carboxypeptidase-like regulatory domain-containing protein [Rhodohalobacter sp. SW132]|uniref:TonB-dependent receptor n=1 Tax=Rhodohalobacter sp. SW132 TaxID=2293433 RepID=UPI000E23A9CD|nr:carboxypeptidase-like regulatory domain-containing protein [Rhodohalobacter sp. SW132]REL29189.1 carboxypeptidase-like regulatory domain-containing protein [Rhodohalobacter sp. SW132]
MKLLRIYIVLAVSALSVFSVPAAAQDSDPVRFSFDFRGESLETVLDRIAREAEIDLVYDPDIIRGAEVYQRVQNLEIRDLLRSVLSAHGLDFLTLSSGTIVIVTVAAEDPAYGVFTGKVVDGRTGHPLPGATVMLADASGGTSTGQSGNFAISRLISGEYTIIFSYVGYEAVTKSVRIPPNERIQETVSLQPKQLTVAPVIVESHRPGVFGSYSNSNPNNGETLEAEAMMSSPIRDLSLVPGVQHGLPMNGIQLQGSQQSENRLLLDGAPVYNPHSIGKMFSAFSPHAIGRVTLNRAGFGASEASSLSGAVDLSHDLGAVGNRGATLQADPLAINLRGDYSFDLGDESSLQVMSAFRNSYWDTYRDPVLRESLRSWDQIDPLILNQTEAIETDAALYSPVDHDSELNFYDAHFASRLTINSFNELYASFYASENELNTAVLNRSIPDVNVVPFLYAAEQYQWKNRVGQISWNSLLSPRINFRTKMSYSYGSFSHSSDIRTTNAPIWFTTTLDRASFSHEIGGSGSFTELPGSIEGNNIHHFRAGSDLTYSFSSNFEVETGLHLDHVRSGVDVEEGNYLPTFSNVKSSMVSSHLTGNYRFGSFWHLSLGSRLTYLDGNQTVYAEPRISVQYDKAESRIGYWSARISGGLYRQFINEYSITNTGASAVVPGFSIWSHAGNEEIPKAYHLAGSWYLAPSENSTLRLEAYYKWQPVTNITSYRNLLTGEDLDRSEVSAFAESTEMRALGGSIRANRSVANDRISLMGGYDYSFTRVDMTSQFGKTVPAPWSDPHRVQFRMMWRVLSDLKASVRWQGIYGRTWAYREAYYNYLQLAEPINAEGFDFSSPEQDFLSPFSQVDFSLVYSPSAGRADMELRLDLVNILNRKNELEKNLVPVFENGSVTRYRTGERTMPGFYPSVSLQISF